MKTGKQSKEVKSKVLLEYPQMKTKSKMMKTSYNQIAQAQVKNVSSRVRMTQLAVAAAVSMSLITCPLRESDSDYQSPILA
jgi:hypothetical protein